METGETIRQGEGEKLDPYAVTVSIEKLDPYRVCRLFDIDDAALAQAVKKLLRCGRKHKSRAQDIREVITTLERWEEMEREDAGHKPKATEEELHLEWECVHCGWSFRTNRPIDRQAAWGLHGTALDRGFFKCAGLIQPILPRR